jgi:hypothetical protein
MREGDAGTSVAVERLGAGPGQLREVAASRKPSTNIGVSTLSRTASGKGLLLYSDLQKTSLQQLLKENENVSEVAERLLERARELERKVRRSMDTGEEVGITEGLTILSTSSSVDDMWSPSRDAFTVNYSSLKNPCGGLRCHSGSQLLVPVINSEL